MLMNSEVDPQMLTPAFMSPPKATPLAQSVRLHSELRPRKSRTKTGCLTCRGRHKKCDEQRLGSSLQPTCASCRKSGLVCLWPPQPAREVSRTDLSANEPPLPAVNTTASSLTSCRGVSPGEGCTSNPRLDPVLNPPSWPTLRGGVLQSPGARLLLEHYTLRTANVLAGRRTAENPFLTCVLPRALADELILCCILGLSATHRAHNAGNQSADHLYSKYYVMTVRMLQVELDANMNGKRSNTLHLLLAVLLLATTEGVDGNTDGAVYHHLRVSRPIISTVLASATYQLDQELRSFLIDLYAYLVLVSNITFTGDGASHGLLDDPLLSSLEPHRSDGTYGSMMGCAHGLFELIPSICRFASTRMQEIPYDVVSTESLAQYSQLEQKIRTWTVPGDLTCEGYWFEQLSAAAHIYQHALLLFLHTAFLCSSTVDDRAVSWLQPEIDTIFLLAQQLLTAEDPSPLANTLLWPTIIMGSCLRRPEQQRLLCTTLMNHNLAITDKAALLLDRLWTEGTENGNPLFGPIGLKFVMDKYRIHMCMA